MARIGHGADGGAQKALQCFGVQMLFKHLKLAGHPGFPDQHIEWRHGVGEELMQALAHQALRQLLAQVVHAMIFDQVEQRQQAAWRGAILGLAAGKAVIKLLQFLD